MVEKRFSPVRVFLLGEPETGSSQDKLIVVVVVPLTIHEVNSIVNEPEIHAGDEEALCTLSFCLVLGNHLRGAALTVPHIFQKIMNLII